jgi:hypothetical protein
VPFEFLTLGWVLATMPRHHASTTSKVNRPP